MSEDPAGLIERLKMEFAVKMHKLGVIDFPELTINFEVLEKLKESGKL